MNRRFTVLIATVCFGIGVTPAFSQVQTANPIAIAQRTKSTTQQTRINKTTRQFSTVVAQVEDFATKHGTENVLLVIDLDNTLLAMNQDLGSDQWFTWQQALQSSDRNHPDLVTPDFARLLEIQGILFALGKMHPPEPELPDMVGNLTKQSISTVILTSRGKEFRDASERELKRNNYNIALSTLQINEKRGAFTPYSKEHPNKHGLNADVIASLGSPRLVTYSNGIYMTAGQHKGYMLKTLLARAKKSSTDDPFANFKAIVFVDDHRKHVDRVQEAFAGDPIALATFRYSREDENVDKFRNSAKDHVTRDWNQLDDSIKSVFSK